MPRRFPPSRFIPTLLTWILTVLVLGIVWHVIFGQLSKTLKEEPLSPHPVPGQVTADPQATVSSSPAPTAPNVPPASLSPDVRTVKPPPQLRLLEEAHEHRGLSLSCKVELKRLCADVEPGGGRLKRCYREREDQLSHPCLQEVEEQAALSRVAQQQVTMQCAADVRRLCPTVRTGQGRILQCLEDHYQNLSQDCYHALEERLRTN